MYLKNNVNLTMCFGFTFNLLNGIGWVRGRGWWGGMESVWGIGCEIEGGVWLSVWGVVGVGGRGCGVDGLGGRWCGGQTDN